MEQKKQTHSSQWVLLGEGLIKSPTYEMGVSEGSIAKGLKVVLEYLFMVYQPSPPVVLPSYISRFTLVRYQIDYIDSITNESLEKIGRELQCPRAK